MDAILTAIKEARMKKKEKGRGAELPADVDIGGQSIAAIAARMKEQREARARDKGRG